jgi:uncharacterized protein
MNELQAQNFDLAEQSAVEHAVFTRVYGWMAGGLLITAITAAYVSTNQALIEFMVSNRIAFFGLLGAELLLVFVLSAAIQRMTSALALSMFLFYAALNGVTLSLIFLVYTAASLGMTFAVTAGMFGAMCAYGALTKRDLTSLGSFMFMGLIGLIIASFANFFLRSEMIYWITTYFGVFIFVGLTAYDAQKVKALAEKARALGTEDVRKASILGALGLYLDFINLFLYLLRLFGRRRD